MGSLPATISLRPPPLPHLTPTQPTPALPMVTLFSAAAAGSQPGKLKTPTASHSPFISSSPLGAVRRPRKWPCHPPSLLKPLTTFLFWQTYGSCPTYFIRTTICLLWVCNDWPVPVSGLNSVTSFFTFFWFCLSGFFFRLDYGWVIYWVKTYINTFLNVI